MTEHVKMFMATQEIILPEMDTCRHTLFDPAAQNLIDADGNTQNYLSIEVTIQ